MNSNHIGQGLSTSWGKLDQFVFKQQRKTIIAQSSKPATVFDQVERKNADERISILGGLLRPDHHRREGKR